MTSLSSFSPFVPLYHSRSVRSISNTSGNTVPLVPTCRKPHTAVDRTCWSSARHSRSTRSTLDSSTAPPDSIVPTLPLRPQEFCCAWRTSKNGKPQIIQDTRVAGSLLTFHSQKSSLPSSGLSQLFSTGTGCGTYVCVLQDLREGNWSTTRCNKPSDL